MGKVKFDPPTNTFPYKIAKRTNILSVPRKYILESMEGMPMYSDKGVRKSALGGQASDRVHDVAWPYVRKFIIIKKLYKHRFSPERMERIDRMIEAANATGYAKLANCVIDLKKQDVKDVKKKRGWTESEWKKHMEYISTVAAPKKLFKPPPIKRGKSMPLEALIDRINEISLRPGFKVYKRLSEEDWYRDPEKVSRNALKYMISERTQALSIPRVIHAD